MLPLVTPVAANITSPCARSRSPYLRLRSVIPRRCARPRSSSLRKRSLPCICPPMQRRAAAARTPAGAPPEGVLAAAALRCIGGQMQGRLLFRNDDERGRAHRLGITDLNRKYGLLDLAHGDVMFAATGVTNGSMLKGVRRVSGGAFTHSVVMRSKTGTVRYVEATHDFTRKPAFAALGR